MDKKLVLITGVSGAGKTTATNILEDMGYCCIDRYPSELLSNLIDLIRDDTSYKYQHVALTIPITEYERYRSLLSNTGIETILILMDADKEEIIKRYKFTRRVHPLLISNKAETLEEAISLEKKLLADYEGDTPHLIDTTHLNMKQHKEMLDEILHYDRHENFSVSFVSFGFKNGIPQDADFVFDVRVLDNPFYIPELRSLTGNDPEVYDYVMSKEKTKDVVGKMIAYLDQCFALYEQEDKRHITVCIGCTGGQHRSVSVANYLYEHYKERILCFCRHREMNV
ncbi:MAG: RNase adapter RapZ [Erysipelotrichaceae bacterium]|nr:RNase adapter RapZ [Erysipelotrichaceae bacterium]